MNFTLEKWELKYSSDIRKTFNDRRFAEFFPEKLPFPFEEKHARYFIEQRIYHTDEQQFCRAIIADGKISGGIDVFIGSGIYSKSAELVIWVTEPENKPIAAEALKQVCSYIFEKYNVVRLFAKPYSIDYVSSDLYEAAGFTLEGTMKKSVCKNSQIYDQKIYAIIR